MRYSLANYNVSIIPNDPELLAMFSKINIGGEGDAVGSISTSRSENLFTTNPYATGAYVHNKHLSKSGTCSISISQLAPQIAKLKRLVQQYEGHDWNGLTITVSGPEGAVASCVDAVPQKIPDQSFGAQEDSQSWVFTCGEINYQ